MTISILIPHYAVGKICAYSISKILENKGRHDVQIVVIDNNPLDGSAKYLEPFRNQITYVTYPPNRLQSHGIGINYLLEEGFVRNEWFITLENDAFPISENFIDYYENLIHLGYDAAVSMMKLSGGYYGHGCGALYSKSLWKEVNTFVKSIPYTYFPNMAMKSGFATHLMIHNKILDEVLDSPNDWIELADGYKGLTKQQMLDKAKYYSETTNAFHCGMGGAQEDIKTYGFRSAESDAPHILVQDARKIINRLGYEPNQYLYYYMVKTGKKIFEIPTQTKWMPNREHQQQEYSLTESGIKHLWAISSYTERGSKDVEDVYELKRNQPEILYNTLPEHQKIKQ
jgi:hypothetical protein